MNKQSLCWSCKNTNANKCSWFKEEQVLPKRAKYTEVTLKDSNLGLVTRKIITKCPNYEREDMTIKCSVCGYVKKFTGQVASQCPNCGAWFDCEDDERVRRVK